MHKLKTPIMESKIYYFIDNLTENDPKEEIIISENLVLKNVPDNLLLSLKINIKQYICNSRLPQIFKNEFSNTFHEFEKVKDIPPNGIQTKQRVKEDFRYLVLEESNSNRYNLIYPKAFSLAEKDYFIPFAFSNHDNGVSIKVSFSELCIFTYYNELSVIQPWRKRQNPNSFSESDKKEVIEYINLLNEFEKIKEDFPFINKALNDFFLTREVSDYSVFKIVSYIACLEMLLVDSSQERLKSITVQLQTKLSLLNNQFEKPIIISDYIKGPDTLKLGNVIEVFYNYRSSIAHGNFLDFKKKLQLLEAVSENEIFIFIKTVLKKTLIYALKNPELVRDLKEC